VVTKITANRPNSYKMYFAKWQELADSNKSWITKLELIMFSYQDASKLGGSKILK